MHETAALDSMVSVVIPVWDEDPRTLHLLHERLSATLRSLTPNWEMLFTGDGSPEATSQTLQMLAEADSHVRFLRLKQRCGQETALLTGLLAARGQIVCTMDCDLECRPEDIPVLVAPLQHGYDLVFGCRGSQMMRHVPRHYLSRVFNHLMNARWGVRLQDWGCGFNAGRREVFEVLRDQLGRWNKGPLKVVFLRRASRWTHVEVTQARRPYGHSGYTWYELLWRGYLALTRGTAVSHHTGERIAEMVDEEGDVRRGVGVPAFECAPQQ